MKEQIMKLIFRAVLGASLILSPLALAAESVCIMERDGLKDCYQNKGLDEAKFKEFCNSVNQIVPGAPPAKITFTDACPNPTQGICKNAFGQPLNAFYYNRDEHLLEHTKNGCAHFKGTWSAM
jgi:hypothetical protein